MLQERFHTLTGVRMIIKSEYELDEIIMIKTSDGTFSDGSFMNFFIQVGDYRKAVVRSGEDNLECLDTKSPEIMPLHEWFKAYFGEEFVLPQYFTVLKKLPVGIPEHVYYKSKHMFQIYEVENLKKHFKGITGEKDLVPMWKHCNCDGNRPNITYVFAPLERDQLEEISCLLKSHKGA